MIRYSILILVFAGAVSAQTPACTLIDGDQLLGRDLARAVPAFRAIPSEVQLGPAPLMGAMRVFSEPELETLGARFGLPIPILTHAVCFRLSMAPLDRQAVQAAMQRSLHIPEARIELDEVSAEPAPAGTIQFPLEMLGRPANASGPVLWRGEVVFGTRHFNIWARVHIMAPTTRLVAAEDLRQGVPVQARQLRLETVDAFPPLAKAEPLTVESMVGLLPTRVITAGSEIRPELLTRPLDVSRGDLVHVEVRLGRARLMLNGRAETAGRVGDLIAVRNTDSSRIFQARVQGKGKVLVDPQSGGEY